MPESIEGTQEPAGATQEPQKTDQPAETDWKAEARKWESRAKEHKKQLDEAAPKLAQFDAFEKASKTELERAQEEAKLANELLSTAQREALVNSVALEQGLSAALARRLQGSTREELLADAAELKAQFPQSTDPRAPRVDPSQGSSANKTAAGPEADFAAFLSGQLGR